MRGHSLENPISRNSADAYRVTAGLDGLDFSSDDDMAPGSIQPVVSSMRRANDSCGGIQATRPLAFQRPFLRDRFLKVLEGCIFSKGVKTMTKLWWRKRGNRSTFSHSTGECIHTLSSG